MASCRCARSAWTEWRGAHQWTRTTSTERPVAFAGSGQGPPICAMWPYIATIPYMAAKGIRELKDNLSHYIRRVEAGERIAITAHGRVVAELGPPGHTLRAGRRTRYDDLVASGVVRLPVEDGDPLADWVALNLPPDRKSRRRTP